MTALRQFSPVFATVLIVAAAAGAEPEPRFKGKPTSHWITKLDEKKVESRREAVVALATIGPEAKAAVPALIQAMDDDDSFNVRDFAVRALARLGPAAKDAIAPVTSRPRRSARWARTPSTHCSSSSRTRRSATAWGMRWPGSVLPRSRPFPGSSRC